MATKTAARRPTSRSSRGRSAGAAPAKRYGSVTPRIWTKPLRKLTPKTSLGFDVIEFADWIRNRLEELARVNDEPELLELAPRLLEWQRWLLIHALELLPGPDLVFRFRTVLLLVARQNGKSTLLVYLILWRMYQDGARMVLGTAQSVEVAEEAWSKAVEIAEAIPELADEIDKVKEGKGSQLLKLDGGERYRIAAANRRGGRGFTGDLVIFDELREHQTWKAWSAASKTTMARDRAQVWGVSNAGDASSIVLRHLRKVAIAQINGEIADEMPDDLEIDGASIGLFEWSAGTVDGTERGAPLSVWDRDGWAQANPSLGHTITETAIAAAAATDTEHDFRTEVLCQFVNTAGSGPFPTGSWQKTRVAKVTRDRNRPATYGIDMSHDRTMVHVVIAFWDTEGRRRVELAASRAGTEWLLPWLQSTDRAVEPEHVTLQTNGAPVSSLITEFEEAGIELTTWAGPDLARACGLFFDGIRVAVADDVELNDQGQPKLVLTHGDQPALDVAATTARIKALGDGWVIDRRNSTEDAAPLMAAIGAHWLLMTNPAPPARSAYEDRGLMVV